MAIEKLNIDDFLTMASRMPVIDVRSPAEFYHAHIPDAHSVPIFDDEERSVIGTAYKQESREKAIKIGLEAFGKKMNAIVETAEKITGERSREVAVHCWRGGMRSGAIAWLLDLYGYKVFTLSGGYKAYRRYALDLFSKPWQLAVLGGYTGSNKTGLLNAMIDGGMRAIDLEKIAGHRGSAFGNLDLTPQPSQEQFENALAMALRKMQNVNDPVWVEAESQRIGLVNIPNAFFIQMRKSPLYFLDVPVSERLTHIVNEYAAFPKEKIANAIERIRKKLGNQECNAALEKLTAGDFAGCFGILLSYYDRLYLKTTRTPVPPPGVPAPEPRPTIQIVTNTTAAEANLQKLLSYHAGKRYD